MKIGKRKNAHRSRSYLEFWTSSSCSTALLKQQKASGETSLEDLFVSTNTIVSVPVLLSKWCESCQPKTT